MIGKTNVPPSPHEPLSLLGGLAPASFMRRHWQRKPLLVRSAIRDLRPFLTRAKLFAMAARDDVEARLIVRRSAGEWELRQGPLRRSSFPSVTTPGWTLLIQGLDLYDDAAHALLQQFRFVPDARLDDLMISWASDGGGVGPHFDSYDVFLLQAQGRRRWRIGRQKDLSLEREAPLKILSSFTAEQEFVLEPGDMLYLPPKWAHDGVADGGECMTYSIGLRAPRRDSLAAEICQRIADDHEDPVLYQDRQQAATQRPAQIPPALLAFAADAVRRMVEPQQAVSRALGEVLTEPKAHVWFENAATAWSPGRLSLDRRTRMMYDDRHVFINGESTRLRGRDADLMRRLADDRRLEAHAVRRGSAAAQALLEEWFSSGWLHLY
jgi:50S ribosomal protein L16 3-hydroxylase